MVGFGTALAAAGSGILGGISGHKAHSAYRANRKRIGKELQYGRGLYSLRADQALQSYLDAIGRSQEGTQAALAETERLGYTGQQDLYASLEQQLARNRQGAGSVLAQSSLAPAFNRGAYSDYRRDLGALRESIAARRAGIHMTGAAQEVDARQALANALFRRGQAEFEMQQALASRFGGGMQPQSFNLGGLGAGLDELFKLLFPGGNAPLGDVGGAV